jgi:hypothetical protein
VEWSGSTGAGRGLGIFGNGSHIKRACARRNGSFSNELCVFTCFAEASCPALVGRWGQGWRSRPYTRCCFACKNVGSSLLCACVAVSRNQSNRCGLRCWFRYSYGSDHSKLTMFAFSICSFLPPVIRQPLQRNGPMIVLRLLLVEERKKHAKKGTTCSLQRHSFIHSTLPFVR